MEGLTCFAKEFEMFSIGDVCLNEGLLSGNNKTTLERPYWGTLEDKRKKVESRSTRLVVQQFT